MREQGMQLGDDVNLPPSTWIDEPFCFLISIGDHCGFGGDCMIFAHDTHLAPHLGATRIGRVVIHESCHLGSRTIVLPGVEIGPRTLVGANSVVTESLPPDTVCAGNPARVICSLEEYLTKHREQSRQRPNFDYMSYSAQYLDPRKIEEMKAAVRDGDAYIVGGRSAELRGEGGGIART